MIKSDSFTPFLYYCPYCLQDGCRNDFGLKLKRGISLNRYQCPSCDNIFTTRLLDWPMTIKQYAEWVCVTAVWDFNHKLKWDKIKLRLKEWHVSNTFWTAYYAYKGEPSPLELERKWGEYEGQDI